MTLKGKIVTGQGEGKKFLDLFWVKRQIQEKLQFIPCDGTLNLTLNTKSTSLRYMLKKTVYIKIKPAPGFCNGIVIPALINSKKCAIIIPKVINYPKNKIEIIAPFNIRQIFKVKDGDEISVQFLV